MHTLTLSDLWVIMMIGRHSWGLEESKCHSYPQVRKMTEGTTNLSASLQFLGRCHPVGVWQAGEMGCQLMFSKKRKVLHLEWNNPIIMLGYKLNMSQQCVLAEKRANGILAALGLLAAFWELILLLYSALVRPHPEYCVQLWAPQYKRDQFNSKILTEWRKQSHLFK